MGVEISEKGKIMTDDNSVDNVVKKFQSKYSKGDVKRYYPKTNVAIELLV